jgi:hypothetical protein
MIEQLPSHISIAFGLTTLATLILFHYAIRRSNAGIKANMISLILIFWLIIQAVLSLNNFYNSNTLSLPPRFILLPLPPLLVILILFLSRKGRRFIDGIPLTPLTYLHVIRIPVEITLYWLFLNQAVPELMTFAGRNFDILAGLTAPLVAYFGLQKQKLSGRAILIWNFVALALLLNIVINAVLSAPSRFQQFAFDQPNIAVLNFPFSWLPGFVVPVVLFAHLVAIRQLLRSKS